MSAAIIETGIEELTVGEGDHCPHCEVVTVLRVAWRWDIKHRCQREAVAVAWVRCSQHGTSQQKVCAKHLRHLRDGQLACAYCEGAAEFIAES